MRQALINNPDMSLSDIMTRWPGTIPVFVRHKMLCVGCLISPFHTIPDVCAEYGLDEDSLLAELERAAGS